MAHAWRRVKARSEAAPLISRNSAASYSVAVPACFSCNGPKPRTLGIRVEPLTVGKSIAGITGRQSCSSKFQRSSIKFCDEPYHQWMSYTYLTESEVESSPRKPLPFPPWWRSSRWPTFAALAIAVIAAAVAIAAWIRPAPESASPTFTDRQTAQAKTNVCSVYTAVHQGVVRNTHLVDPNPNDPAGQLAI